MRISDWSSDVCSSDLQAVRVLVRRYNQQLFRVARGVVHDDGEAEDIVQAAYVRAFTSLDGYRGEASFSTWLTRIALNEACGRLRRRRPTVELSAVDATDGSGGGRLLMFPGMPEIGRASCREGVCQYV